MPSSTESKRLVRDNERPLVRELPVVPEEIINEILLDVALQSEDFIRSELAVMRRENPVLATIVLSAATSDVNPRDRLIGALSFYYGYRRAAELKGERLPLVREETRIRYFMGEVAIGETLSAQLDFFGEIQPEASRGKDFLRDRTIEESVEAVKRNDGIAKLITSAQLRLAQALEYDQPPFVGLPFIESALEVRRLLKIELASQ